METAEPQYIPGEFVVFSLGDEKKGMGQVLGAVNDSSRNIWQYYIVNPYNAQTPYLVESSKIQSVYRTDKWEPSEA